jgi:hypothetical protein
LSVEFGKIRMPKAAETLRNICAIMEDDVDPELENVEKNTVQFAGAHAAVEAVKTVACGYGETGFADKTMLQFHVDQLDNYNREAKPELTASEEDALAKVCRIMENDVEPEAKRTEPYGLQDIRLRAGFESDYTMLYLKTKGVGCSVEAVKKVACGLGLEHEKKDLDKEITCLNQFLATLRTYASPE